MNNYAWLGLVLVALGVGCGGGDIEFEVDPAPGLDDPWGLRGLEGRYVLGSEFPVVIEEADEVASLDPSIFELVETAEGLRARAVAVGETEVEVYSAGERVAVYGVRVIVPDELQIAAERADLFTYELRDAGVAVTDEVAMLAGGELYLHARYFEGGERVYGGDVLEVETDLEATVPDWSPQGNVVRLVAADPGTYVTTFRVAGVERNVSVHVADAVVAFELYEPDPAELLAGEFLYDQVIKPRAQDAEGRILQGTLPISWSVGGATVGTGTLLGVLTEEGVMTEVTATLAGLSATATARGTEMYVAP